MSGRNNLKNIFVFLTSLKLVAGIALLLAVLFVFFRAPARSQPPELVLKQCMDKTARGERMECLKQQVPHLYRSLGGKRVAEAYEDYEGDFFENTVYCHEAAHVFGETIYAETKDITDAFAICPQACKGGCAHGAVAAMSVETPLDRPAFKYLAELCRESGR